MSVERSLEVLRNILKDNYRLKDPSKIAAHQIEEIIGNLKKMMETKYEGGDQTLRQMYNDVAGSCIEKFINSTNLQSSKGLMLQKFQKQQKIQMSVNGKSTSEFFAPPVIGLDLTLANINTGNLYQHVMANALDYMYAILCRSYKPQNQNIQSMLTAYNELNDLNLFFYKNRFENTVQTGSPGLRNICKVTSNVFDVLLKEKAKLQVQMEKVNKLNTLNYQASREAQLIFSLLDESNTVYYKEIVLGSDAVTSKARDSWTCGDCGETNYNEKPIVSANTIVLISRLSPSDIRGYIHFAVNQCTHCGKYNILPGSFMSCFESVMANKNAGLANDIRAPKEGQMMAVGYGMLYQTKDMLQTLADSEENEFTRQIYSEDLTQMPEIIALGYRAINNLPEPKHGADLKDLAAQALPQVDKLLFEENISAIVLEHTEKPENTNAAVSSLQAVYGDRLLVDARTGKVQLAASRMFVCFAKLFLESSVNYGYSQEDLIRSVCSVDTKYYSKLCRYRDLSLLQKAVTELKVLVDSVGYYLNNSFYVTAAKLQELYHGILKMPVSLYGIINNGYPVLTDVTQGIDLRAIESPASESEANRQGKKLLREVEEINGLPDSIFQKSVSKIKAYVEEIQHMRYGVLKSSYSGKTIILSIYCDLALPIIKSELHILEAEILNAVVWEAEMNSAVIDIGDYSHSWLSPLHFIPKRFKEKIVNKVYFRMLKNTLYHVRFEEYFGLSLRETSDPYALYHKEMKRVCEVLGRQRVPEQVRTMFCNIYEKNKGILYTGGTGSDWIRPTTYYTFGRLNIKLQSHISASAYRKFITELFCDIANIMPDYETFQYISFLTPTVLDITASEEIQMDTHLMLVALLQGVPPITPTNRINILSYLAKQGIFEAEDSLADQVVDTTIWESETESKDSDKDVITQRTDALNTLLLFYPELLDANMKQTVEMDLELYERETE